MKKNLGLACLALACLLPLAALPKVAVLDIAAQPGIDPSVVVPVTETIMEEVVGARAYVVLDRAYVEQVMKEMEFELSGLVGDTQATKAGQFLGADYVVAGKVQTIGDAYFIVAKMIEVRSGVIVAQASEQGEGKISVLLGLSHAVGKKLVSGAPVSPLEPAARATNAPGGSAAPAAVAVPQAPARRFKAGFLIPTPANDPNFAPVAAIERIKTRHASWLDVVVAEKVQPENCGEALDLLIGKERCDILISFAWGLDAFMTAAAESHPKVIFESVGGAWSKAGPANLGIFAFNESLFWYLEGLVAGALSPSGKIGVVSESPEGAPWIRQYVNTFALGVKAASERARIALLYISPDHWSDPAIDIAAVQTLVSQGCDFIRGDLSLQVSWHLESLAKTGVRVRLLQKDFTYKIAPTVTVSGPLHDWEVLVDKSLRNLKAGTWKRDAYYPREASRFGGGEEAFNPAFMAEIQGRKVKTPDRGTLPLLDLIALIQPEMDAERFNPYFGPIKDQKGNLRIKQGVIADWRAIEAIDWYLDNVRLVSAK